MVIIPRLLGRWKYGALQSKHLLTGGDFERVGATEFHFGEPLPTLCCRRREEGMEGEEGQRVEGRQREEGGRETEEKEEQREMGEQRKEEGTEGEGRNRRGRKKQGEEGRKKEGGREEKRESKNTSIQCTFKEAHYNQIKGPIHPIAQINSTTVRGSNRQLPTIVHVAGYGTAAQ